MLRNKKTHQKIKLALNKLILLQQRGPVLKNQRTHQKRELALTEQRNLKSIQLKSTYSNNTAITTATSEEETSVRIGTMVAIAVAVVIVAVVAIVALAHDDSDGLLSLINLFISLL